MTSPYDGPQPALHAVTSHNEKITLRLPVDADLPEIVRACTDPETLRWTTIPRDYDRHKALGFIHDYAPGWWRRRQGGCWVIADAADRYLGQIDLRVKADSAVADVGFLTSPDARGQGVMTAALRAVAEFGLRELGLQRIEWLAHIGNDGSRKAAERAGFKYEGVRRAGCEHRGKRLDVWSAAIVRADLDSAPGA